MDLVSSVDSEARFAAYVEELVGVIGHADRALPLRDYCLGLLMPGRRKSVEPMAAITAPTRVAAQHQSLLHFVGNGPWSDQAVLSKVRELVLPAVERHGPIEAWIIDDTGFPKKGRHSVGVARQYCGQRGEAGQTSGGGDAVVGQPSRQPADRLPAVSSARVGRGRRARRRCRRSPGRAAGGGPSGCVAMRCTGRSRSRRWPWRCRRRPGKG